jgi:hypothetical protein
VHTGEIIDKRGIRGLLAAGAVAALATVTGCSASGPDAAAGAPATITLNGPYGVGGPFATVGAALPAGAAGPVRSPVPAGPTGSASPRGSVAAAGAVSTGVAGSSGVAGSTGVAADKASVARVDGSTAFGGSHKAPWLAPLGYGVSVSAPQTVRPGTAAPGDAEAGFYDAFYTGRLAAACAYVVPGQRGHCPASLRASRGAAGSLRNAAVGFVVAKGAQAVVTMTGLVCGGRTAPSGCLGQRDPAYVFGNALTFEALWARIEQDGGNPLTATPLRRVAGHWYVDLILPAS